LRITRIAANQKKLLLSLNIDPNCPRFVRADPLRIGQVLMNLVSNAVKFTERGSVEVRVRWQPDTHHASHLQFEVRDTGIGISREAIEKLFTSFTQAEASTARRYGGTGLGLAICKRLTELMGGEIRIESELQRGTNAWFTVSLQFGSVRPLPPSAALTPRLFIGSKRVLLAEDNLVNQRVASRFLERLGYLFDVAASGPAVLEAVKATDYGLVLMDCEMPELNGYDTTRQLRRQGRSFSDLPIIALTAHASDGEEQRCLEAGMNGHLTKPVAFDQLRNTLLHWIGRGDETIQSAGSG
jgi:CheY-like chemotaxis protein